MVKRTLETSERDSREIMSLLERLLIPYGLRVGVTGAKTSVEEGFYRFFLVFDTLPWLKKKIRIKIEAVRRIYRKVVFDREPVNIEFPFFYFRRSLDEISFSTAGR